MSKRADYRFERKFLVSELTLFEIESMVELHPAIFSEIYHQRFLNNIYFDSFDMRHYSNAVNGLKDRLKVRIRWYGDLFGLIEKPVLELKIKNGLLGRKEQFPLAPFSLDAFFRTETIVDVIKRSDICDALRTELTCLEVALLNRYSRKYFQSADRMYRLTVDSGLEFYRVRTCHNTFLEKSVDHVTTIVELKYDLPADAGAERITCHFPFRMTKSSKYADGIERLYL